jgi:hypothetical protein
MAINPGARMPGPSTGGLVTSSPPRSKGAGARPLEHTHRRRPAWQWLLSALLLVAVVSLLLSRCDNSEGKTMSSTSREGPVGAKPTHRPGPQRSVTDAVATPAAGSMTPAQALTVDEKAMLSQTSSSQPGDLIRFVAKPVRAIGVPVQSVPADEGFWVGTSATNRVWVQLMGPAESAYDVEVGDKVSFSGRVVSHGAHFAARVGVSAAEGARELTRQRGHLVVVQSGLRRSEE